jgi:hypothetical protein
MKQIRQGDILLIAVNKTPPAAILPKNQVILAEGEATGHAHRLSGEVIEWTEGSERFVRIIGQAFGKLSHEDHDPEPVAVVEPEVTYRIIPQQETDLSGQWRKVVD